jgi:hypothetical protein
MSSPNLPCYTESILDLDRTDWIAFAIAAILVIYPVVISPTIGLADNGDFAKVTGKFGLCAQIEEANAFFRYATTKYIFDSKCYWDPGFKTTEAGLVWIAVSADRVLFSSRSFDIRLVGLVHCALFLAAFGLALPLFHRMRPLPRRTLLGMSILVFCDVMYVEYYNSFFTDAAAFLFLFSAAIFYLRARYLPVSKIPAAPFYLLCCCLFLLAKAQHAPLAIMLVFVSLQRPLLLWPSRLSLSRSIAIVALAACGLFSFLSPPKGYTKPPLFTVIFFSLLPSAENPGAELRELGLDDSYRRYSGMTAYSAGSPMADWDWGDKFVQTTSYKKLASFYVRHPWRAAYILRLGLDQAAYQRPLYLGNFDKSAGYPPAAKANRFSLWSATKKKTFENRGIAYALYFLGLLAILMRRRPDCALQMGALAALALGIGALADSAETTRHLFIFNFLIDLSAIGAAAALIPASRRLGSTQ